MPFRLIFNVLKYLDRSPAFLTSDGSVRSNEIIRTKWQIYVVIGHFVLTILSERKKNRRSTYIYVYHYIMLCHGSQWNFGQNITYLKYILTYLAFIFSCYLWDVTHKSQQSSCCCFKVQLYYFIPIFYDWNQLIKKYRLLYICICQKLCSTHYV